MSESTAPVTTETATPVTQSTETTQAAPQETTQTAPTQEHQGLGDAPAATTTQEQASVLSFIPEQFKNASWATKYKTPEDFFKGVEHMTKTMGQKQVVNGIVPPAQDAPDEEWDKFHTQIGRPEAADKYALPEDISAPEGYDIEATKANVKAVAHKAGLTQKQATALYKEFMAIEAQNFTASEEKTQATFNQAIKQAFPEDTDTGLAMAKRGAKALGIGNTLDQEGLSANPLVLKLCAKLGELAGEDTFVDGGNTDSKESILEEAKKIQASQEYMNGDKALHQKVERMYQQVYK